METGAIANFLKNSMQELFAGVRGAVAAPRDYVPVSYTHLRAHET